MRQKIIITIITNQIDGIEIKDNIKLLHELIGIWKSNIQNWDKDNKIRCTIIGKNL